MARRLLVWGLSWFAAASCSGSTGPSPTIAGTWHVTVQQPMPLMPGTLTPSTFDVVITPVPESAFAVTAMPALLWSQGPFTYDTLPAIGHRSPDSPDSILSFEEVCRSLLCEIFFRGRLNRTRDTLTGGMLQPYDTVTINGRVFLQTMPVIANFTAHK
jgi:hypothetical protein